MKCKLITQIPKIRDCGFGYINITKGEAIFCDNSDRILYKIIRTQLISISADGISISGFESIGFDKKNREKFVYHEWYLKTEVKI